MLSFLSDSSRVLVLVPCTWKKRASTASEESPKQRTNSRVAKRMRWTTKHSEIEKAAEYHGTLNMSDPQQVKEFNRKGAEV